LQFIGKDCKVPLGALVIDGKWKFLMPGLVDMHVHVNYKKDLILFIANGVTTIRNMRESKLLGVFPYVSQIRNQVNKAT
jgi:dihydroorotase-like cyclic amidohydrolase